RWRWSAARSDRQRNNDRKGQKEQRTLFGEHWSSCKFFEFTHRPEGLTCTTLLRRPNLRDVLAVLLHGLPMLLRFLADEFAGKISPMRTVFWEDNKVKMIDQRILPARFEVVAFTDHKSVARAITDMVVRGAPAIGATAAFGLALAGFESASSSTGDLLAD